MPEPTEWTPQERRVAAELSRMPAQGAGVCLEPEDLLDLIETPDRQPVAAEKLAHIATCPTCRRNYVEMQAAWHETTDLRHQNRMPAEPAVSAVLTAQTPETAAPTALPRLRFPSRWRPLFASSVSFALGAAAVWLILIKFPHDKIPHEKNGSPPESPDKQISLLQHDIAARDTQIAQLEQERRANLQKALDAQTQAAGLDAQLQRRIREGIALKNRLADKGLANEDYRQAARLLASAVTDPLSVGIQRVQRGPDGPTERPPEIDLLTAAAFAVRGGRPTLACRPLAEATDYHLDIDTEDRSELPVEALTTTRWRIKTPLRPDATRDRVYRWSVRATRNGREVTSQTGQFVVLSQAKQRDLDRRSRRYAHLPLALGLFYRQAGLLQEAEQQFRTCRRNPEKRALAEQLLQQLRSE